MNQKIRITSDCVCDLSEEILDAHEIPVIYFYVTTDSGCFKDMREISARNIVEYFESGGQKNLTKAPDVAEYKEFFENELKTCDEVIHVAIAHTLSKSVAYASEAAKEFGGKVHVFDSGHLSTGIGHLVLYAVELAEEGKSADAILTALKERKEKVSTSFIAESTRYLYRAGRVSKWVDVFSRGLRIHPILKMKDGELKLDGIEVGNYQKSIIRYIRRELKKSDKIDKKRLFVTHCNCSVKMVNLAKKVALEKCKFEQVEVTSASATISGNCGANTIGVLFVRE